MNKKRLLKVADRMEEVHQVLEAGEAPVEFDLYEWGTLKEEGVFENREDMDCMTAACAIGHCGTLFKDDGFSLVKHGWDFQVIPQFVDANGISHRNWEAVTKFFDLSKQEAEYLFMDSRYRFETEDEEDGYKYHEVYQPMPAEVADRIRRFVRSGKIGKW